MHTLTLTLLTFLIISCNSGGGSESSHGVSTNFAITGSGMNATVKSSSWFFPEAHALTPPPLLDSNLANVDLYEAKIVVKKVHFYRTSDPAAYSTSADHYDGPFVVDLLDGTPEPFGQITLYNDGLRRVKMLLHKDATTGYSMYLRGQVNGVAFSFSTDDTTDFQVYGENAVTPESGKKLMVTIRIADLFKKIDLSVITANTDISATNRVNATNPCPLIHATATNLYTCFRQGMNKEAKFGKDDGDDDLDDSESVN